MEIRLTPEQNRLLAQALSQEEAALQRLIRYPSGRLKAELITPFGPRSLDLTPDLPPATARHAQWLPWLLFGSFLWLSLGLALITSGLLRLPGWADALWIGSGAILSGLAVYRAQRVLATPLLLTREQSRALAFLLARGYRILALRGGGGTHLMGRGPLMVRVRTPEGEETAFPLEPNGWLPAQMTVPFEGT